MIRKISYIIILISALIIIGLADFFTAGCNPEVFTDPNYWFALLACALANYMMTVYTAIEKIDTSIEKNPNVKAKKEEVTKSVVENIDTDFDDYLSDENRERKIKAWKNKISNKIARLDEFTKDKNREVYWYGTDEQKAKNRYCRKRRNLLRKLSDEYINKNIYFLRVKYTKLRRYEVTHGCKQKGDQYKITTKKNLKVARDNLPRVMRSLSLILMVSSFAFGPKEFTIVVLFQFLVKLGSLFVAIYNGISYGNNYIEDTLMPDYQYRIDIIIKYMNWKIRGARKNEQN